MRSGILASPEQLRALRDRVQRRPFDEFSDHLEKRCALILESPPISEGQWRSIWSQGKRHAAVTAAQATQGRILDLLVSDAIDTNRAYRSRALEELQSLLSWSTWHDPSHTHCSVDLCTAEAAVAVVLALDWAGQDLPASLRNQAVETLHSRVLVPYLEAVKEGQWWYSCYHSWNAVVNGGCGLTGLFLEDEFPEGPEARRLAIEGIKRFQDALSSDGGWDEGPGYWGYGFRYLLLLAEGLARLEDDQRLYHHRGMDQTGLFPIYFSPNGQSAGFGDAPIVPLYGALYLLENRLGCEELGWWLDTYSFHRDTSTTSWSAAGLAIVCRSDAPPRAKPDLEPVKTFSEIGWACMADRWPRPGFYASIKAGDLAANRAHHDMNSLVLQVDGERVLVDLPGPNGSYDYAREQSEGFSPCSARSHNTLIVAEEDHRPDARGRILTAEAGENYRWIACDAGEALGEGVRFVRHLVMTLDNQGAGQSLIVLDEIDLGMPEKVEAFWHVSGDLTVDGEKLLGRIRCRQSDLQLALASTTPVNVWARNRASGPSETDRYVHLSGGVMGRALMATVFSRREITESLRVDQRAADAIVSGPGLEIRFTPGPEHLKLESVG
jgi:hypothetical protein